MTDLVQETIERLLPIIHKAWAAGLIPPGPCPSTTLSGWAPDGEEPQTYWCWLRAGHVGDHETDDGIHHARWKNDTPLPAPHIPPGPCPHTHVIGGDRNLYALCDLRAGHAGQHEAGTEGVGHCRWSAPAPAPVPTGYTDAYPTLLTRCAQQRPGLPGVVCWKEPGHPDAHDNGAFMWNDCGEDVARDA